MLAICFIILTFLIGLLFASNLKLTDLERILASFAIGIIISSWMTFLPALIFRSMKIGIIISFFSLIVILIFFRKRINLNFKVKGFELILVILLLIFSSVIITKSLLIERADGIYSGLYLWGDTPFHLSIMNSFSNSNNFPPQYPIYAGHKMGYYFLFDFFSGILKYLNFNLRWSLILPNILALTILFSLFYCFSFRLTKNKTIAIFSVFLLIFSGGLGFIDFIKDNSEQNLILAFLNNKIDYTYNPDLGYEFMNFTVNLLPQRGGLLGYALILLVFVLLIPTFLTHKNIDKKQLVLLGGLAGLLVMFHVHSFIGIVVLLSILAIYYKRKDMLYFFIPAGMIASLQIPLIVNQIASNEFISFHLGWLAPRNPPGFIIFWLKNLGFLLPLFIMAFFIASEKNRILYLTATSLFIIPNIVRLQPWIWDNTKIFMIWLMIATIGAAESIYFIYKKRGFGKVVSLFSSILVIFSGVLTIIFLLNTSYLVYTNEDLTIADWIIQNTAKRAVFLTAENHNHIVPMLAGRKIYRGYSGWLWSHGFDWLERIPFVKSAYEGQLSKEELLAAGISYIYIGPMELNSGDYKVNLEFFEKKFKKVFEDQKVKIYSSGGKTNLNY